MILFEALLYPLNAYFANNSANIDLKSHSEKLFFEDFCKKLFYAFEQRTDSLRTLVNDLKDKDLCKDLGFNPTPFSTLKDGFSRFKASFFVAMFQIVLASYNWASIRALEELGTFCLIDGSLFPTLIQMQWTAYKSSANACKLHLCFELNRMIPTEFMVGSGNSSERNFLISIAKAGITYIADRGYFSFDVVQKLVDAKAFFILRLKSNILFTVVQNLEITHSVPMPAFLSNITDCIITFSNDKSKKQYRLICFSIGKKLFHICTNRLDINTLQIIILYAFRWQIELMFKFLKRTLNGIHLFNHSENGVQIQFYILLCLALLLLRLKQMSKLIYQESIINGEPNQKISKNIEELISYFGHNPSEFIKNIAQCFYTTWKISKQFVREVNNFLNKPFDFQLIMKFADT